MIRCAVALSKRWRNRRIAPASRSPLSSIAHLSIGSMQRGASALQFGRGVQSSRSCWLRCLNSG